MSTTLPQSGHPLHQPLGTHERYMRALWIFAVAWIVLWLILFWLQPVGLFRSQSTPREPSSDIVRIIPAATPFGHQRPMPPKPWEQFFLEQGFPVLALYLILSIPAWLAAVLARSRSWWAGAIIGAVIGFLGGWLLVDTIVGIGGALIVGIIGCIFDYVVSTHYKIRLLRGHMPSWWAGGKWGGRGHSRWRWGSV